MKSLMKILCWALLCLGLLGASWPDKTTQDLRIYLWFYDADQALNVTGRFRGYVDKADSSLTVNQFDFTFDAGQDSSWYIDTPMRETVLNIYRTLGSDSLVRSGYVISGRLAAQGSVDDSSIVAGAVGTSEIADRSIQTADIDTNAVGGLEIGDHQITGDDLNPVVHKQGLSFLAGQVQADNLIALDDLAVTDDASIGGKFAQTSNAAADSSYFKQMLYLRGGAEIPSAKPMRYRKGTYVWSFYVGDIGAGDGTFSSYSPITQGVAFNVMVNQGSGQWGWAALDSTYVAPGALSPTDIAADGAAPNDALTYNGTKWDPVAWEDSWRLRPYYFCDFTAPLTTGYLAIPFWYGGAINSGSLVSNRPPTPNHPGVVSQRAGLGADSGYYLLCATGAFEMGGGECFEASLNVETTANTTVYLGLHDATTASAPVDGAYIRIVGTTLDGQTAGASFVTTTGTSYTITIATFYRLRIVTNAAASRVDFYLWNDAGTLLWTNFNTTNLPSGSGQTFGSGCTAHNAAGGSAYLVQIDYFAQWWGRALTR